MPVEDFCQSNCVNSKLCFLTVSISLQVFLIQFSIVGSDVRIPSLDRGPFLTVINAVSLHINAVF